MDTKYSATEDSLELFKKPLCLVETNDLGQFVLQTSVLEQINSIEKHVVVVSIVGPYRTGKSYLMNRLAGSNTGFPLGSTVQSKTKGIWAWVRTHPRHPDRCLVLLDTEGLSDVEKGDENHDNLILCLATLLSSTLVYNVIGIINNDSINKLHFITELSKHLRTRACASRPFWKSSKTNHTQTDSEDDDDDAEDDDDIQCNPNDFEFPDFVYVLRDFFLDLEINGLPATADDYLEHGLALRNANSRQASDSNRVRKVIRQFFHRRKCFTFVRPVPGKTAKLEEMTDDQLLPDFLDETCNFIDYIMETADVKTVNGKKLTGKLFGSLLEAYLDQITSGALPHAENAVDAMTKRENAEALEGALQTYQQLMLEELTRLTLPTFDESKLNECHTTCLAMALDLFISRAFLDEDQTYQKRMLDEITQMYGTYVEMNNNMCYRQCREYLHDLQLTILRKLQNGDYIQAGGFSEFRTDIEQLKSDFMGLLGPYADKMNFVLMKFLENLESESNSILAADQNLTETERQAEEQRLRTMKTEIEANRAESRRQAQESLNLMKARSHEEIVSRMQDNLRRQREESDRHMNAVLEQRLAEQRRLLQEGFNREADKLRQQIAALAR